MIHVEPLQFIPYETVVELQDFKQYKDFKLHDFWKADFRLQVFVF